MAPLDGTVRWYTERRHPAHTNLVQHLDTAQDDAVMGFIPNNPQPVNRHPAGVHLGPWSSSHRARRRGGSSAPSAAHESSKVTLNWAASARSNRSTRWKWSNRSEVLLNLRREPTINCWCRQRTCAWVVVPAESKESGRPGGACAYAGRRRVGWIKHAPTEHIQRRVSVHPTPDPFSGGGDIWNSWPRSATRTHRY